MANKSNFQEIALALISRGLSVTPLKGKAAFLSDWNVNPCSTKEQVEALAQKYPEANCGVVRTNDYWMLDVDSMDWFMDNRSGVPKTLVVKTGSGKLHFYFKHNTASRQLSMRPVLNPSFDKKKTKEEQPGIPAKLLEYPEQCVAPGSVHPDTGRAYVVYQDLPLAECPQDWIDWLSSLSRAKSSDIAFKTNPLKKGWDPEIELQKAGLKFSRLEQEGKVFFNYHSSMGKCLIRAASHAAPGENPNPRQCAFVHRPATGEFWHFCFSCGTTHSQTKIALEALGLRLEDAVVPAWRGLFSSKGQLNQEPLIFVVNDFIPEGTTGFGGPSGHTKTWLMLSVAKAIRMAPSALWGELLVPKKYEVLYMTPEVGDRAINKRLKLLKLDDDEGFLFRTQSMGQKLELNRKELLIAAQGKVVFLDTLVRWLDGREENSSKDIAQLFDFIQDLLSSGAVAIIFAHHSPKGSKQSPFTMSLEGVFRGSGDIGANLSAGHGVFQLDNQAKDLTLVHIQCVKPRDFEPLKPFHLQGKPFIDETGDFKMVKKPGECGFFQEELKAFQGKSKQVDSKVAEMQLLKDEGKTNDEIALEMKVSTKTVQRALKKVAEPEEEPEVEEAPF